MRRGRDGALMVTSALSLVVAIVACYGPTQVTLVITTDAQCKNGIETQIYAGNTADPIPIAVTSVCGPMEPRIGTMAITPTGSRKGQFELEVGAGLNGVKASDCKAKGYKDKNCIVARRRVSFHPHDALVLPIALNTECANMPCTDQIDQTCDRGTCTPIASCDERGCPRERGEIPTTPAPDAGSSDADASITDAATDADAMTEGGSDAAITACDTTKRLLVSGQNILGHLAFDGPDIVYANGDGRILRVPRTGGSPTLVKGSLMGLSVATASNGNLAWLAQGGSTVFFHIEPAYGGAGSNYPGIVGDTVAIFGPPMAPTVAAFGTNSGASYAVGFTGAAAAASGSPFMGTTTEIKAEDDGNVYGVTNSQTIVHFTYVGATPTLVGSITSLGPTVTDFALSNQTLYVAAAGTAGSPGSAGVHAIPRAQITNQYNSTPLIPGLLPKSFEVDAGYIFHIDQNGTYLIRAPLIGMGAAKVLVKDLGVEAARVALDDTCVYWVEGAGGQQIWSVHR